MPRVGKWRKAHEILLSPLAVKTPVELKPLAARACEEKEGWIRTMATMDTGAQRSAAPRTMAPSYAVLPSEGSKRGDVVVSASGDEICNEGQQTLPTMSNEGVMTTQTWQIADIIGPLCSVGEECDKGHLVVFGPHGGACLNLLTGERREFPRTQTGAYEMEMWVPTPAKLQELQGQSGAVSPEGFGRQGRRRATFLGPALPSLPQSGEPPEDAEEVKA